MVWLRNIVAVGILFILSIMDLREQKVSGPLLIAFGILGILGEWIWDRGAFGNSVFFCLWITACCILASKVTRQGIGRGDVILLAGMAFWKNGESLILLYALAFVSAAVFSLFRYGFRNRTHRFAFIPWITGAFLVVTCLEKMMKGGLL